MGPLGSILINKAICVRRKTGGISIKNNFTDINIKNPNTGVVDFKQLTQFVRILTRRNTLFYFRMIFLNPRKNSLSLLFLKLSSHQFSVRHKRRKERLADSFGSNILNVFTSYPIFQTFSSNSKIRIPPLI